MFSAYTNKSGKWNITKIMWAIISFPIFSSAQMFYLQKLSDGISFKVYFVSKTAIIFFLKRK